MTDTDLIQFTAPDGLTLAARDTPGPGPNAPVVLCLHGLTRNGRDFEGLIETLRRDYRVIAPDQRGRGRSSYAANPLEYNPVMQTLDTWALLDQLGVERCAIVGTSMGALMGVMMANQQPDRVWALALNDAGPVVDPRGLARIAGYVGQGAPPESWAQAAGQLRAVHGHAFPTYSADDWDRMARATYTEDGEGLRLDYDPRLAEAFGAASGVAPNLWPLFDVFNRLPGLVLRGALSDILSADTAAEMAARFPGLEAVTVPDRGHAPDLREPQASEAILRLLSRAGRA
jgi:pimeloyl-ACP methyl ester carboxylesterase